MQSTGASNTQTAGQKHRRAAIACIACRQSKIKCSGDEPCASCQRRSIKCQFSEVNDKVLVSERYLRDLQRQAYNWQRATGIKRPLDSAFRLGEDGNGWNGINDFGDAAEFLGSPRPEDSSAISATEPAFHIWTNPFTLPTTIINGTYKEQRKWIWLAPSSAWSFTARLIFMMTEKLDLNSEYNPPRFYLDGDIYPFAWSRSTAVESPDTSDLPSVDYALYLFQIVRFRLGRLYRFFDDSFVTRIREFSSSRSAEKATESRFWFVQFLVVLALGSAFISRPRTRTDPPGSKYFARAMSVMPNDTSTGKDSLLAIEALALTGIYLYAIDHREAAHVQVGHAIRIAQMEGLHTQLPEEVLGAETVTRCRHLWWTLYIIDRHFSSSLGLPMTTKDSDITTLVNGPISDPRDLTFSLQVRLTRMLSFIIDSIYKTEKTPLGTFLEITRSILGIMAQHAEEFEKMIHVDFSSIDNVPQEARHTILLYHQCVIVATRPLLLSVLMERLEKLGRAEEDWQKFLTLPKSLISIGIKSADKILQILHDENSLLETFLPFDLELTYAAAIHLTLANASFPSATDDHPYSLIAHSILDEMILSGNKVAEVRKEELRCIENLFRELNKRVEQQGLRVLRLSDSGREVADTTPVVNADGDQTPGVGSVAGEPWVQPQAMSSRSFSAGPSSTSGNIDSLGTVGISSAEFLSIVDQISNPTTSYGAFDAVPDWLAGDDITASFT